MKLKNIFLIVFVMSNAPQIDEMKLDTVAGSDVKDLGTVENIVTDNDQIRSDEQEAVSFTDHKDWVMVSHAASAQAAASEDSMNNQVANTLYNWISGAAQGWARKISAAKPVLSEISSMSFFLARSGLELAGDAACALATGAANVGSSYVRQTTGLDVHAVAIFAENAERSLRDNANNLIENGMQHATRTFETIKRQMRNTQQGLDNITNRAPLNRITLETDSDSNDRFYEVQ